jgi:N-acetylmuramoyl-L-alanine amidase
VREALESRGLRVRTIEEVPLLYDRTTAALGADLFVSIHHDSVRPEFLPDADFFTGFSLFVSRLNPQVEKSIACASAIGGELRAAGLAPSRYHADPDLGEDRSYADKRNGVHFFDDLAVARTATMPAVLVEAGVIVNRYEERELRKPCIRRRIAEAIAQGVLNCLP